MSAIDSAPEPRRVHALAQADCPSGASLSPELEAGAARRVAAVALVTAGVSAVFGVIGQLAPWSTDAGAPVALAAMVGSVAVSLGLHAAIRTGRLTAPRTLALGVAYEVAQGLFTSVGFFAIVLGSGAVVRGWSSVAVWMIVFPLIVPARPRRNVVATLLTGLTDPLGLWLNVALGAPAPSSGELARIFVPTLVACVIAPISARIVYGLTLEVKRAREMGSYRLIEKLGQGGMGEVWKAEHRMLARDAAIKLIGPGAMGEGSAARTAEAVKRFEREARATARLRSPHTVEVYDYGVAPDGTFHYVMELLDGFSLQTLVKRFGPLPPERVVHLLRQACHSLAEAHADGLVHRDIKPANLFVCRLGLDVDFVKVLDFGLVKLQGVPGSEALTVQGGFAGTPGYVAPEVALGESVDGRADIYALGCVAYWLLTGQRVFESPNAMQMVVDHVRTPPVRPSARARQEIPEALEGIVLRCLEKDPARRPASAGELSAELDALGLEGRWTETRAQGWWRAHAPTGDGRSLAPPVVWPRDREETLSQIAQAPGGAGPAARGAAMPEHAQSSSGG